MTQPATSANESPNGLLARPAESVIEWFKREISLVRLVESQGHQLKKHGKDYSLSGIPKIDIRDKANGIQRKLISLGDRLLIWINLGFDFRCPMSKESSWKVGTMQFSDFSALIGQRNNSVKQILSFDLNLSPRPSLKFNNGVGREDMNCGAYSSAREAMEQADTKSDSGMLVFWQVERDSFLKAKNEGWFDFLPEQTPSLPKDWLCIGLDVVNNDGLSEYWDLSEDFWAMDKELTMSVNEYGLISDESKIEVCRDQLPLNPFSEWVMPVRAWIKST